MHDLILAGGGLANGLLAFRLKQLKPELNVLLIEGGSQLGGNHTWSFHESDLTSDQLAWVKPFITASWKNYSVKFPEFERKLEGCYHSIRSEQFHTLLSERLGDAAQLNQHISQITTGAAESKVTCQNGATYSGRIVLDGRGLPSDCSLPMGYQKFLGRDFRFSRPHKIDRPLLMDATVTQTDGYRFIYLLPWSEYRLLIEETHYSNSPTLDPKELGLGITDYITKMGWHIDVMEREESGVLPVPLSGSISDIQKNLDPSIACSGVRAGLFHCTTSYSFPLAVQFADWIAALPGLKPGLEYKMLPKLVKEYAEAHWNTGNFFRLLNRMLFQAADPADCFKIFQKFYRLQEGLIQRFYAGKLTKWDCAQILSGKPPVPIAKAMRCFF